MQVSKDVKDLADMFPAVKETIQRLAADDVLDIAPPGNIRRLQLLKDLAADTDPMIEQSARQELLSGHVFGKATASDDTQVMYGDEVGEGATHAGARHQYQNVSATRRAKVQYGNRVGMKGSFWDSK